MAFIRKEPIQVTGSTAGAVQSYSSNVLNGFVLGIRYEAGALPLSTKRVISIGRGSSADLILKFAVPSSGRNFYPRQAVHGSTGNVIGSTVMRCKTAISDQRLRICVDACSSANSKNGSLYVYYGG